MNLALYFLIEPLKLYFTLNTYLYPIAFRLSGNKV